MKRLYITLLITVITLTAAAIPAKRGQWKDVRLADGTTVRVEMRGDEHLHYWQSADGRVFQEDSLTGFYQPRNIAELLKKSQARRSQVRRLQQTRRQQAAKRQASFQGVKKGLIILAEFQNLTFQAGHDKALYNRIANERGFTNEMGFKGSVKDYFIDQSEGQFELDFDVVGPVTVSQDYAYYGKNDSHGDDVNPGQMIYEAVSLAKDSVDFRPYDWDGDGEVDQVFVVYAGVGEAQNQSQKNSIWPHMWDLQSAYGKTLTFNGVTVNTYACSSELSYGTSIDGIGTFCHEFSHCMGFPDLYDTGDEGNFGMGSWSLMDYGSYNGGAFVPCGYTSYERMVCGWKMPIELTEETTVDDMLAINEGGNTYVIYNGGNKNEYYLLENRQLTGWDRELPGHGLLVLHVDYDANAWYENTVNNDPDRQRCTIIHADNKDGWGDEIRDPYPYKGNDSLTNLSTPAAKVYNANSDGTYYLNRGIRDIKESSDGIISFRMTIDPSVPGDTPIIPTGDILFYESFNKCNGKGGNDGVWKNITSYPQIVTDIEGWYSERSGSGNQCARIGSGNAFGLITTPLINITDESTLTFKAAPWGDEQNFMHVELADGYSGVSLSETIFDTMTPKQWNDHTVTLTGSGTIKLMFWSNQNRFFLDEVKIFKKNSGETAIKEVKVGNERHTANGIFSLDGRYLGTDFNLLQPGIYIVNGRKTVRSLFK
ncbi:MAG: M6 family metalloprotease domain-containing protein [Prevotella sp.]|nr:M6 family metalloprotease domain-containing protein [Prevotella sp.]